jgi:hypothetical protein
MTDRAPFAIRILAEVWHLVAWTARGFLAAVGADPTAFLAFVVLALTVLLSLPLALRTLIVAERWIARHVAAHHKQAEADAVDDEFAAIVENFNVTADDPMEQLDGVVRIQPQPAPLPHHKLHRRPRRLPGRRMRRHTTSTPNSDRRH